MSGNFNYPSAPPQQMFVVEQNQNQSNSLYPNLKQPGVFCDNNIIELEQNILNESVGSQDQIAASYGGFNKIIFNTDGNIANNLSEQSN